MVTFVYRLSGSSNEKYPKKSHDRHSGVGPHHMRAICHDWIRKSSFSHHHAAFVRSSFRAWVNCLRILFLISVIPKLVNCTHPHTHALSCDVAPTQTHAQAYRERCEMRPIRQAIKATKVFLNNVIDKASTSGHVLSPKKN